jgi:large subunit ribosomal protein L22
MTKALKTESPKIVTAYANHLRISPRKVRLVTNLVKNMHVVDALNQLAHTNKKAAPMVVKLIKSAVANAQHNFAMDINDLYIKSITADMGKVLKRYFPRARGSAFVIKRKMSHVNVELEERKNGNAKKTRFEMFKKKQDKEAEGVDHKEAVSKPLKDEVKKSQVFKTDEQVKMNKVANKRRMFNRKAGE